MKRWAESLVKRGRCDQKKSPRVIQRILLSEFTTSGLFEFTSHALILSHPGSGNAIWIEKGESPCLRSSSKSMAYGKSFEIFG